MQPGHHGILSWPYCSVSGSRQAVLLVTCSFFSLQPGFISPGVMIPPRRLQTLFDQAAGYQRTQCKWHTGVKAHSLLWDHKCPRQEFPTITTHVLAEHLDEVWDVKWSHNGRYLASASVDMTVIVWKIAHDPDQSCTKQATLKSHREPVAAMAWNRDDSRLLTASDSTLYIWDPMVG